MENNNKNNKFVIKKVPLYSLISLLNTLYEDGADYVDLYRESVSEDQDSITVSVPMDYLSDEAKQQGILGPGADAPPGIEYEEDLPPPVEVDDSTILTDDDIKDLLNNV